MDNSKQPFRKSKRFFHRCFPPIESGDRIDYRNMSLISRFISEQGKILFRRVNRLTLKQQRLITIAIKQARIYLCYLFLIMKNSLREPSRSLELLVLEPEINRYTLPLLQNSNSNSSSD